MKINSFVFNPFYENTYVLWDETKSCVIIDPGCYEKYEQEEIIGFIESEGLSVKYILNTHCHIDHVLGNYFLKDYFKCPLWIPEHEVASHQSVVAYAPQWGIQNFTLAEPDALIKEGQKIVFGNSSCKVIEAPGHSPGHQLFYFEKEAVVLGGDVLFRQSIGRTDLPGGNHTQLLTNIKEKIYTLPDPVVVYPGHGSETTVGFEKKNNPFVKG